LAAEKHVLAKQAKKRNCPSEPLKAGKFLDDVKVEEVTLNQERIAEDP